VKRILHIIEKKSDFKRIGQGESESLAWALTSEDETAEFVAFHKTKNDYSWVGGKILGFRDATREEMAQRWPLERTVRRVIHFRVSPEFRKEGRVRWAGNQTHGMAYKSLEIKE
jgi:hypothetical protein